ncbi:MAG: DNA polymerase III subunit gamma/tau [candidate division Zixibacteria bacterium]|nr:DNA polymerase III subunit gamma/tau [candidate division Zixibacteria bacterium]
MSYLVMARKYRPMGFEEVVDQKHVITTLVNAINSKRIAHAYLFSGPRGTGKTTVARILAKSLNCEKGPTSKSCNICSVCEEINAGRSIDVFEMDAASKSRVEDIRELIIEGVKYAPVKGKYKVYIIDEVQMLSDSAFDALLKTIEEPPPNVIFIFATTEPQDIPPTILSRCQRFDFKRIPFNDLVETISGISLKEGLELEKDAIYTIARKADGSLRDCLSLLDQMIAFGGDKITKKIVEHTLGLVNEEIYFKLTDIIRGKKSKEGLEFLEVLIDSGIDLSEFVLGLLSHLRNLLVARVGGESDKLFDMSQHYIDKYKKESENFSESDLLRMIKIVTDLNYLLKKTTEPRIHLEIALLKLIQMDSSVSLETVLEKLEKMDSDGGKSKYTEKKVPGIEDDSSSPSSEERKDSGQLTSKIYDLNLEDLKAGWPEVLNELKVRKASLWSCLNHAEIVSLDNGVLLVEFASGNEFHRKQVEKKDNLKQIQEIMSGVYNNDLRISFSLNSNRTNLNQEISSTSKNFIYEDIPGLKDIIDNLGGEIIDKKPI